MVCWWCFWTLLTKKSRSFFFNTYLVHQLGHKKTNNICWQYKIKAIGERFTFEKITQNVRDKGIFVITTSSFWVINACLRMDGWMKLSGKRIGTSKIDLLKTLYLSNSDNWTSRQTWLCFFNHGPQGIWVFSEWKIRVSATQAARCSQPSCSNVVVWTFAFVT